LSGIDDDDEAFFHLKKVNESDLSKKRRLSNNTLQKEKNLRRESLEEFRNMIGNFLN
jgi:uncharacterized protein YnzC (UPF0291/DUF896 family)